MYHAHESQTHKSNPDHDLRPILAWCYDFDINGMIHYLRGFSFDFWAFFSPILIDLEAVRVDHVDDPLPTSVSNRAQESVSF
jgi:hypothetical protein